MAQISQLEDRYSKLTCLRKQKPEPKNEKNRAKWERLGKLEWAKNYPYEQIINPHLHSMEFWTSNNSVPVESGTYRRIGEFEVVLNSSDLSLVSPTWKQILEQCPEKYAFEGVGLCIIRNSKQVDAEMLQKKWTVWVMKRPVPGSKAFLSKLSDEDLSFLISIFNLSEETIKKGIKNIIHNIAETGVVQSEDIMDYETQKYFSRIVRETLKRDNPDSVEYCVHLKRNNVLKKIRQLRKDGSDVKELVELADIMKRHPERFWIFQNID